MKLLLIALGFFYQISFAQSDSTVYFKEFGWTLTVPSNLKIQNMDTVIARQNRGVKLMEGTIEKKIDTSDVIQLISAEKDRGNLFIANYSNSKKTTEYNYDSTFNAIKVIFYRTIRTNIAGNVDSLSSVVMLDGIKFNKYEVKININDKFKMTTSLVTAFYKGFFLTISYVYTDNAIGEEIELMLKNSKFDKAKKDAILSQSN